MVEGFNEPDHDGLSDGEVQLAFGQNASGEVIHISQAQRGIACGLICPACEEPLVAHKSERKVRAHHFQHASKAECNTARETAAHKFGKQVIAEEMYLWLPAMTATFGDRYEVIQRPTKAVVTEVHLEVTLDQIVPDIIVRRGERELVVEIFVTHRVDETKLAKFRVMGRAVLEINLSKVRHADERELRRQILSSAPRQWLYHPWIGEKCAEMKAEADRVAAEASARRAAKVEKLVAIIETHGTQPVNTDPRYAAHMKSIAAAGIENFIGRRIHGDWLFSVSREQWQARVLAMFADTFPTRANGFYDRPSGIFSIEEICQNLTASGCLRADLLGSDFEEHHDEIKAESLAPFAAPRRIVRGYLAALRRDGLLERASEDRWCVVEYNKIPRSDEWQKDQKRKQNRANIRNLLLRVVSSDRQIETSTEFDEAAWWKTHLPSLGASPDAIIHDLESPLRGALRDKLMKLSSALSVYDDTLADDLLGLPLQQRIEDALRRRRERAEEQEKKKTVERRSEFLSLDYYFPNAYEWDKWKETPQETLAGKTPVDFAVTSDANLKEMRSAAANAGRKRNAEIKRAEQAESAQTELKEIAAKMIPNPELARLWLTSTNPYLGRKRPLEFCVDKATLEECRKELLRAKR